MGNHKINSLREYCQKVNIPFKGRDVSLDKTVEFFLATPAQKQSICDKVGNFCTFKCNKCNLPYNSYQALTRHLHRKSHGSYLSPDDYLVSKKYHKCQLCHNLVLCDNKLLYNHLKKHHNLTLQEYKNKIETEPQHKDFQVQYLFELKLAIKEIPAKAKGSMCSRKRCSQR